jgi:hypothetical protein
MRYLSEGVIHTAASPRELVHKLHKASHAPSADDRTWMMEVSDRTEIQSGNKLRSDTPDHFVADLLRFGMIERLEQ